MKRYAPLLLTFLFLPLLFSCFDLEEDLYDQLEKEDYYTDYESLMASVLRPYEHAKWAETNFSFWLQELSADQGSPDKPGGLSIQLCKSEKKEFYIRYSS